ncbi:MAG: class I SAM-dependent methyltransferase [Candidatus Brocadiaceae bacterium]|nr:class I SAM-dependent methyltransferase [Candidatus Brocadiaceae bacterium]
MGLHNNSFDIVVAFVIIEYLEDDKNFLQEIKRILKPQGILLLSTPNINITSPGRSKPYNKFYKREYQLDEIRKL